MTSIAETPLVRLESESRLINFNVKEPGAAAGSFVYRGELAIKLAKELKKPVLPPELKAEQVMIYSLAGQAQLPFFACFLAAFESLKPMAEVLAATLGANGKYFVYCGDIGKGEYSVKLGAATFYVLPLEANATVFNELLTLLDVEPSTVKKRNLVGKLETLIVDVAKFNPNYEPISYERGLEIAAGARTR
jgi:hypothetical protein